MVFISTSFWPQTRPLRRALHTRGADLVTTCPMDNTHHTHGEGRLAGRDDIVDGKIEQAVPTRAVAKGRCICFCPGACQKHKQNTGGVWCAGLLLPSACNIWCALAIATHPALRVHVHARQASVRSMCTRPMHGYFFLDASGRKRLPPGRALLLTCHCFVWVTTQTYRPCALCELACARELASLQGALKLFKL